MTCKKCGGEMRLWLERSGFKSFACRSCEFVAIAREDSPEPQDQPKDQPKDQPQDQPPRDDAASLRS